MFQIIWCCEINWYENLCTHPFVEILSPYNIWSLIVGQMYVSLYKKQPNNSQKMIVSFYNPTNNVWDCRLLLVLINIWIVRFLLFFNLSNTIARLMIFHCDFILLCPDAFNLCLFGICIYSSMEYLFKHFLPFFIYLYVHIEL